VTPRQRILILREQARLRLVGREAEARLLEKQSVYELLDTCATDSLCATACPVAIDTGGIIKKLRGRRHGVIAEGISQWMAAEFGATAALVRTVLRIGRVQGAILGHGNLEKLSRAVSALGLPAWAQDMPPAAGSLPESPMEGAAAVYFPSCLTRVFGSDSGPSLAETVVAVAARAGIPVWIPPDVADVCCGMPFSSKGYRAAYARSVNSAIERIWDWSSEGRLTVVLDTSPCAWTLKTCRETLTEDNRKRFDALRILDSIEFARDRVVPRLEIRRKVRAVALHPVCSVVKMGLGGVLRDVAAACADEVFIPIEAGCCGFAGDRGFLLPELTRAAARAEAQEILARNYDGYFSSSRTCEIGMSRATGRVWRSFWTLLDEVSR
jgi:D-lactate dehydrogenase